MNRYHGTESTICFRPRHRGNTSIKNCNAFKRRKNKRPLEKWAVEGIQATRRRIAGKSPQINKHYSFCCTQQHISRAQIHILAHRSRCATTEKGPDSSLTYCRWKSHLVSSKSVNQDGGFNHFQYTYKFSNFHLQQKVCKTVHRKLLP